MPLLYMVALRTGRFLKQNAAYALDAFYWVLGRMFVQGVSSRVTLRQYCRAQLEKPNFRFLPVPGRARQSLETDKTFVPLSFERPGGAEALSQARTLDVGNRIRVVGDPGSGKSSLAKCLFRTACKEIQHFSRVSPKYVSLGLRLPIMIELKNFTPPDGYDTDCLDNLGTWALRTIKRSVTEVRAFEAAKLFENYVEGRGLIVFLDGLDEVSSESYPRTAAAINGLSKKLSDLSPNNVVILTMRTQFHLQIQPDFETEFPPVLQIEPFKPSDIYTFLTRWPFGSRREENIARIFADLTDRPTLREMCRNPLVLAMYVAGDQSSEDSITGDTRTTFYDQVVEELLVTRRSRQLATSARTTIREARESLLGRLAFVNLSDGARPANLIPWNDAVDLTEVMFHTESRDAAERALRELAKDTGIITEEREGETLRFIHLTFCEFLAAKEAALWQRDGWQTLLDTQRRFVASEQPQLRSRLNEVIPFAVALLPPVMRREAMEDVSALDSQAILGRCFLETQAYDSTVWREYVDRERSEISSTAADNWNETWLQRLHLFNVVLLDSEEWFKLTNRSAGVTLDEMIKNLVGADPTRLKRVFRLYATQDPAAAFRLAQSCGLNLAVEEPELVIEYCGDPPFLAMAISRALQDKRELEIWAPLLAEAALREHFTAANLRARAAPLALARSCRNAPASLRWAPLPQRYSYLVQPHFRFEQSKVTLSCLSAFLTHSMMKGQTSSAFQATNALREVKSPGRLTPKSRMWVVGGVFLLLSLGMTPFIKAQFELSLTVTAVGLMLVAFLLLLAFVVYPASRDRIYATLVNLEPFDRRYLPTSGNWLGRLRMMFLRMFLGTQIDTVRRVSPIRHAPMLTYIRHDPPGLTPSPWTRFL